MKFLYAIILIFFSFNLHSADYGKDPVLLVHGYLAGGTPSWAYIKKKLIEDGWPEDYIFNPTFKNVFGCNPEHAKEISLWVEEIIKKTGKQKIDIVSHSMGAVDARYYIKYLCGYKFVKDFISIAGANHGSVAACLDKLSCAGKELCVDGKEDGWKENPFFLQLNSCDETPNDEIKYTSIYSKYDEIVIPYESSKLDGAKNIVLTSKPVGHAGILLIEETYQYVKEALHGNGLNNNKVEDKYCYKTCNEEKNKFYEIEIIELEGMEEEKDKFYEEIKEGEEDYYKEKKDDYEDYYVGKQENKGCACNLHNASTNFIPFLILFVLFSLCYLKKRHLLNPQSKYRTKD